MASIFCWNVNGMPLGTRPLMKDSNSLLLLSIPKKSGEYGKSHFSK